MNTIIAHRGASYLSKHDNTIESFQLALDMHTPMIEFDVRMTLDHQFIIYREEQLGGTPTRALTYQQIKEFTKPFEHHIPSLEEVLIMLKGRARMLIDVKETGCERQLLELIRTYLEPEEYRIQSPLDIVVRRIKKLDPNISCGLILGAEHGDLRTRFNEFFPLRRVQACHADFVSVHHRFATGDFLLRMKHEHIPVIVWTLNTPKQISLFLDSEVDGILTDRPDVGMYLHAKWEKEELKSQATRAKVYHVIKSMIPGSKDASNKKNNKTTEQGSDS